MKFSPLCLLAAVLAAVSFSPFHLAAQDAPATDEKIVLTTKDGDIVIKLRPDLAPKHVERIKKLVSEGFYDGVPFHRVIAGFMAQTGDPTGTGTGGSKYPDLKAEFTDKATFERGTIGMARTNAPNTANSQFFICYAPTPFLNGQYTIVGEVVEGMEVADKIKKGAGGGNNGMVTDPDTIVSVKLVETAAE